MGIKENLNSFFYLSTKEKEDKWYLESECSRHMIGDPTKFVKLSKYNGGSVSFGGNNKENIIGNENTNLVKRLMLLRDKMRIFKYAIFNIGLD